MGDPENSHLCGSDPVGERVVSANTEAYLARTADGRAETIAQLSALIAAAHAELLDVVTAADVAGDWVADGATGAAPWLVGHNAIAHTTALEWLRVGDALQDLPGLRDRYASGEMSWDQIRHATKFASSVDDSELAERLPGLSANQISLMARQRRPVPDCDAATAHANRSLTFRRDHRRGGYAYRGFLPFDQGEAINVALDRHAERAGPNAETGHWDPAAMRRADALHDLATRALGADPDPDRATVVIHADAKVIDGEVAGNGFIRDIAICRTGVMRALCDARVEVALNGLDGTTVGIARAAQAIPPWLRRTITHRDGLCRFPGCERRIRQIHHIRWWTKDGPTNADNLIGLCWHHHHLVHDGKWTIEGNPNGAVAFVSPDDRRLTSEPQPLHHTTRQRAQHITQLTLGTAEPEPPDPESPEPRPPD
ncbi:MAG: hypothetical protein ACXIVQ_08030 [Acidimicrobiales bacterium]